MTKNTVSALDSDRHPEFLRDGMLVVIGIAVANLIFHWIFNNRYGYFRDEFDYIACSRHLAWGYVDQPPLIPFLTRISVAILGDSLRAVRFIPALSTSSLILLTAMITRELGGGRYALILSAISIVVAPMYLSDGSLLTTNCLEPLLWMGCVYFALVAINRDSPRNWLWFGVVAGIGLEEKYSIAFFGFALIVGLLVSEHRRAFANKWIWLGGLAALLIFLPNAIWNFQHHWPFLELMHNIRADGRDVRLSPLQYCLQQLMLMGPADPIWLIGLFALFVSRKLRPYRILGIAYLVTLAVFIVLHGKNYYLAPVYPMLIAAGAVRIEDKIERTRQSWLKPAVAVFLLVEGALTAPLAVPILPPDQLVSYINYLPFKLPHSEHTQESAILPQNYADQFGWPEMVATVAQARSEIPATERSDCGIFAQDYGQAGAIDFFGPRYGLPPALSGHQTYFLWGPRGYSGNCLIVVGDNPERLEQLFDQVELAGTSDNAYALERHIPVFICKGSKFGTLADLWPRLKRWR